MSSSTLLETCRLKLTLYNTTPVYSKCSINIYCNEKKKFKIDSFFSVMKTNGLFPIDFTKLLEKSQQARNYL